MAADHSAVNAYTGSFSGSTAQSITLTAWIKNLIITNHDTTNKLYFTIDAATTTAVAEAAETFVVMPGASLVLNWNGKVHANGISVVGNGGKFTVAGV